jgi:hypothetical protein
VHADAPGRPVLSRAAHPRRAFRRCVELPSMRAGTHA